MKICNMSCIKCLTLSHLLCSRYFSLLYSPQLYLYVVVQLAVFIHTFKTNLAFQALHIYFSCNLRQLNTHDTIVVMLEQLLCLVPSLQLSLVPFLQCLTKHGEVSELLGLWTLSIVRNSGKTRKHNVSETESISIFR
jgi:hypothetical protein